MKFFLVCIFRSWTEYGETRSIESECGKTRTRKTPYLETFHAAFCIIIQYLIMIQLFVICYTKTFYKTYLFPIFSETIFFLIFVRWLLPIIKVFFLCVYLGKFISLYLRPNSSSRESYSTQITSSVLIFMFWILSLNLHFC